MESNQGETQLFLLRLWLDEPRQGEGEQSTLEEGIVAYEPTPLLWRGKVQHVVRGEAYAFAGWEMMISYLEAMLHRGLVEAAKANDAEGQQ